MGTSPGELRNIRQRICRGAVELAVVKQARVLNARLEYSHNNIERVPETIHITDLIAVVGRDRQLPDRQSGGDQLDDDFGVEVKVIRIAVKGNRRQRLGGVTPVSRMKLTETCAQE